MRIISWNVNGLRALYKKGQWDWLILEHPDLICLQEVKSAVESLPDPLKSPLGYFSYFNAPKEKKGYSGVALYSKIKPTQVVLDLSDDREGRLIEAHLKIGDKELVLFNVYFPNGGGGPARLSYKLKFYDDFLNYALKLRKNGKSVIFCGDINTAHKEIDLARPKENATHTGFLPEERAWIDKVVSNNFVDVFRHLNPEKINSYTYWDMKTFARERNVGWRIDYFFVSKDLLPNIKKIEILDHVTGSDHCPISLEMAL